MEEIQLSNLQNDVHRVIQSVVHSRQPVLVRDKGKVLVKIVPLVPKPQLGNALDGEAPASRYGRSEAGASGADAFPSRGLGTRKSWLGCMRGTGKIKGDIISPLPE